MTSFFYVVSYCHLSATLQTMSIIIVNLEDNRAVFLIFISLLRFPVDSPSCLPITVTTVRFVHTVSSVFPTWPSQQTSVLSLNTVNWLVVLMETVSVFCAVRTQSLNVCYIQSVLETREQSAAWNKRLKPLRSTTNVRVLPRVDKNCWWSI